MMTALVHILGQDLVLHAYRGLFWSSRDVLIISDPHFGKVEHFRKSGIRLPKDANLANYERLAELIMHFEPRRLLILGDLFHSSLNDDWRRFSEFRSAFSHVQFEMIIGNHDIIDPNLFVENKVINHGLEFVEYPFCFTHYPKTDSDYYIVSGHVHPGIRMHGAAKQTLKLPCFWFGVENALFPAFGFFTGLHTIFPSEEDVVFAIADDHLWQASTERSISAQA